MANSFVSRLGDDSNWLFGVVLCFSAISGTGSHAVVTSFTSGGHFGGGHMAGRSARCDGVGWRGSGNCRGSHGDYRTFKDSDKLAQKKDRLAGLLAGDIGNAGLNIMRR